MRARARAGPIAIPATGAQVGRSEGLALASLDMFARGGFSSEPALAAAGRCGGAARRSPARRCARAFQVSDANPLAGVEGRAELLRRLGATVAARPDIFARADSAAARRAVRSPGGAWPKAGAIAAPRILAELLRPPGPIWPSRLQLGGVPLGDCWRHPAMVTDDATSGLVPLHKLSQWLAYSLIEPLQAAGIAVTDIDGLTGLAEYRNGGLFVDTGVLVLRDPGEASARTMSARPWSSSGAR